MDNFHQTAKNTTATVMTLLLLLRKSFAAIEKQFTTSMTQCHTHMGAPFAAKENTVRATYKKEELALQTDAQQPWSLHLCTVTSQNITH